MIKSSPNFLYSIITGDESLCFAYDLETKCQSSEWCGPKTLPSKKFWFQKSMLKMMPILFFDRKEVIHHKYVPEGQMNVTFYVQVLDRLCKHIARVRPEMYRDRKFFLLHNNAHPHTAAIIQRFLAKKGVAQLSHPPYLPDLTPPPNYFTFPKLK